MDEKIELNDQEQTPEITPEESASETAPQTDTEANPESEPTVQDWVEALETAVRQRDEYLSIASRTRADFDNFRKRNNAVRTESYDDGNRDCVAAILPILDNFERAISAAEDTQDAQMLAGVKMIQKQLLEVLTKRGLEEVYPLGEKFDPNEHNAILRVSADQGEPGTICEVFQKGYRVKEKMVRYAMVKVIEE